MATYRFLTTWLLAAPREAAWAVLQEAERWPAWWRGVRRVATLDPGDAERVGSRYRVAWRSRIPYDLEFDFTVRRLEAPRLMEGEAAGQLSGTGCWRLFEQDGVTAVVYDWDVRTASRWMNLAAPLARRVFEYNHDVVMRWGGEGLARQLGAPLVAAG
jgi:uncharacterized protein YndB with AHSA1/START domain